MSGFEASVLMKRLLEIMQWKYLIKNVAKSDVTHSKITSGI